MSDVRRKRSDRHGANPDAANMGEESFYPSNFTELEGFVAVPHLQEAAVFLPLPDFDDEDNGINLPSVIPRTQHIGCGPFHFIFLLCILILIGMGTFVFRFYQAQADFSIKKSLLSQNVIFQGVSIDGLDVGGLNPYQAFQRINNAGTLQNSSFSLRLEVDEEVYVISEGQLAYSNNIKDVIQAAYAIGRQGFVWMIGSDKTPFEIRYEHTRMIKDKSAHLQTSAGFSQEAVKTLALQLAQKVSREPQNAQLASFDFETRIFTVSKEATGVKLDAQAAFTAILNSLQSGHSEVTVRLETEKLLPQITAVELQNSLTLLSSSSTETSGDELRNTNIALAARSIHGLAIMPGESFSFNRSVGQRTAQRGYQLAPAIAGGVLFDDIGGGICQVSSTLCSAAALGNMTIVTRSPHAWPVSYVEKGLDATVNWPNIDFVFKNDTMSPVFIVSSYANRKLNVELYGMRKDDAESIRLETEVMSTARPPDVPSYQYNASLMPGESRELKKARTGYVVDTYRVYLREGQVYKKDRLFTSSYPMVQQVIEFNDGGG